MKLPSKFKEMTLDEQEKFLVSKYQRLMKRAEDTHRLLSTVRGGQRVEIIIDERPDETVLKSNE
jgi:hypothetical protein